MNLANKIILKGILISLTTLWTSISMGLSCSDILTQYQKIPPSQYIISGVQRTVYIVDKDDLSDYISKNGLQHTIDARMDGDALPLVTNKLRSALLKTTLKGLHKMSSYFTNRPIFRKILEFNGTEDGILRTTDIIKIGQELQAMGIDPNDIWKYEIQVGNKLFSGSDFQQLLKETRTNGNSLSVDVDFGYTDPLSNGLSFLYQWYPRAWAMGLYSSFFFDYNQAFVDVSLSSLKVYLAASVVSGFASVVKNPKKKYFNLFMYLPSLNPIYIYNTEKFNFIKPKRAKVAINNIELAAEKAPDWKNILVVVDDPDQAYFIQKELENRFNN